MPLTPWTTAADAYKEKRTDYFTGSLHKASCCAVFLGIIPSDDFSYRQSVPQILAHPPWGASRIHQSAACESMLPRRCGRPS
jgi:hypothetical protein